MRHPQFSAALRTGHRFFSISTQRFGEVPSLADVTAEATASYKENVRQFRERQQAALRPSPADMSEAPNDTSSRSAPRRVVDSILYGSEKGKKEEEQLEQSYGKILARGKYVHEIVVHSVKPGAVERYAELIGDEYPRVAGDQHNMVHLVGSWRACIGDADTFVHIWEYQGYSGYHETLSRLASQLHHKKFLTDLAPLLRSRTHDLMQEFSFWPTSPPRALGGIFELRTYTLRPGNLLEWETHWRRGLEARRNVMEGVGAWFTQVGSLNTVHHLWQFKDLRDRQISRERSWEIPGWSGTVHKTVPLIAKMESKILVPMPWSPVR